MIYKIVNYSHPLSKIAKAQITQELGNFEEVIVPVDLDLDADLWQQVDKLVDRSADYVILPALGVAAYMTGMLNSHAGIIYLKRDGSIPPNWMLGGII